MGVRIVSLRKFVLQCLKMSFKNAINCYFRRSINLSVYSRRASYKFVKMDCELFMMNMIVNCDLLNMRSILNV